MLVILLAMAASAAVKKKRFDMGGGDTPTAAEVAPAEPEKPAEESRAILTVIAEEQKVLREKLTAAISAMKRGDWDAIWKFLAICLVYGMLHALGPGHGKSIVVGYFIARRGRWRQGVALGAGITVTHTMSAVILPLTYTKTAHFSGAARWQFPVSTTSETPSPALLCHRYVELISKQRAMH